MGNNKPNIGVGSRVRHVENMEMIGLVSHILPNPKDDLYYIAWENGNFGVHTEAQMEVLNRDWRIDITLTLQARTLEEATDRVHRLIKTQGLGMKLEGE